MARSRAGFSVKLEFTCSFASDPANTFLTISFNMTFTFLASSLCSNYCIPILPASIIAPIGDLARSSEARDSLSRVCFSNSLSRVLLVVETHWNFAWFPSVCLSSLNYSA